MKRVSLMLLTALLFSLTACSQEPVTVTRPPLPAASEEEISLVLTDLSEEASEESLPSEPSAEPSADITVSDPLEEESAETDISLPEALTLPDGVKQASKGKLRYSTSVLSLTVTFPEEFCAVNPDYTPKYGIYLQNMTGTATLLMESVEDKSLTFKQWTEYLKNKYPDAAVHTTDKKEIICKTKTVDQSGKLFCLMLRLRPKNGGYNQILLCCRPEDESTYAKLFNEIQLS